VDTSSLPHDSADEQTHREANKEDCEESGSDYPCPLGVPHKVISRMIEFVHILSSPNACPRHDGATAAVPISIAATLPLSNPRSATPTEKHLLLQSGSMAEPPADETGESTP
jgi:hypothetical protein